MVKLNLPLRPWVPQWLGIVTMFVVMFPIIMLNGTYTGSMLEVSSTLGILSEDITMGYYAAAAGMAVAYPIIPKIRAIALQNDAAYRPDPANLSQLHLRPGWQYGHHHYMQLLHRLPESFHYVGVYYSGTPVLQSEECA